jgi:hypothetical protein
MTYPFSINLGIDSMLLCLPLYVYKNASRVKMVFFLFGWLHPSCFKDILLFTHAALIVKAARVSCDRQSV